MLHPIHSSADVFPFCGSSSASLLTTLRCKTWPKLNGASSWPEKQKNSIKDKCLNIGGIVPICSALAADSLGRTWPPPIDTTQGESHIKNVRWYLHDYPSFINDQLNDDRVSISFAAWLVFKPNSPFSAKTRVPFHLLTAACPHSFLLHCNQRYSPNRG